MNKLFKTTSCLWCGEKAVFKIMQKGYQEPDLFEIFYCQSCNTSFSMPRINEDLIYNLIYKNIKNVRGYSRYLKYQNEIIKQSNPLIYLANSEPSYWGPIQAIQNILKVEKSARILEVGSGLGYFTYSLKMAGYNVQGLEISMEAVNEATKRFGDYYICDDLLHFAEINKNCYDIVIMTEVIEHISDPKDFILSSKQLLKKKGVCVFTTPNKSFYPKEVSWFSDAPPIHCWWFSEESIKYVANLYDMELKLVDFKKYYMKFPELYKVKNIENEGQSVFDRNGSIILDQTPTKTKFRIPNWIKSNKQWKILKNLLIRIRYLNIYKKGNIQSNIICAILTKN